MEREHLEDIVDGRIILKRMLNNVREREMNSYGSKWAQIVGFCEHSNDERVPQNVGNFLTS
jgi:hypothetical protein